jgi:hypothetical protein
LRAAPELSVVVALVIILSVVSTVVLTAWFFLTPEHPERGASHADEEPPETLAMRLYGRHPSGPAGPDAESQNPEDTGNSLDPRPPSRQ